MMERDGLFRKSAQEKFTQQVHKHEKEYLTSRSKEIVSQVGLHDVDHAQRIQG